MIRRLFLLMFVLAFSALACAQPVQKAETPPTRIPPSTQDALALQSEIATASAKFSETGDLSITFTEQQLTGLIIDGLASQQDVMLNDPQVVLQNGQIQLSGKILLGKANVPISMVLMPTIQNDALVVSISSASFGVIPVPEKLLTQITDLINQNLTQAMMMDGQPLTVQKVEIANGTMTITGKGR